MRENLVRYVPTEVDPPGETLRLLLEEREISRSDLALQLNQSASKVDGIISGDVRITPEIAGELELALGTSAIFWLRHEEAYRAYLERTPAETMHAQP